MANDADRAVGQSGYRHRLIHFGQHVAVEVAEVAGILEGVNLPAAVLEPLVEARHAGQHHGQLTWRTAHIDNVLALTHGLPGLDEARDRLKIGFGIERQAFELEDQSIKLTRIRRLRRTGHHRLHPNSPGWISARRQRKGRSTRVTAFRTGVPNRRHWSRRKCPDSSQPKYSVRILPAVRRASQRPEPPRDGGDPGVRAGISGWTSDSACQG